MEPQSFSESIEEFWRIGEKERSMLKSHHSHFSPFYHFTFLLLQGWFLIGLVPPFLEAKGGTVRLSVTGWWTYKVLMLAEVRHELRHSCHAGPLSNLLTTSSLPNIIMAAPVKNIDISVIFLLCCFRIKISVQYLTFTGWTKANFAISEWL